LSDLADSGEDTGAGLRLSWSTSKSAIFLSFLLIAPVQLTVGDGTP
jgi:hypothetical protein